jgi:dienelactone hydrolase
MMMENLVKCVAGFIKRFQTVIYFLFTVSFYLFLSGFFLSDIAAQGTPPQWLSDVQKVPDIYLSEIKTDVNIIEKSNLLLGNKDKLITTIAEWEKKRTELQEAWITYLGPMTSVRKKERQYNPPQIEILEEIETDGFIRKKILYQTEPGQQVRAYLMLPKKIETPRPAVVVFHGTNQYSYHQTAGVFEQGIRANGYHLVRKGYVVICPQNWIWYCKDEIHLAYRERTKQFRERNPDNWGMARMILDAQIAVDILVSLNEVDPRRIGCAGHSLGGKQALYLPAFDERVYCSVSSEGGIGIEQSNWEADWYLGAPSKAKDFARNHREILAMVAPRPFLLIGGNASDGDASWKYIETVLSVYRLYGEPACLGLYNYKQGHTLTPEAEKTIYEWLDAFLVP